MYLTPVLSGDVTSEVRTFHFYHTHQKKGCQYCRAVFTYELNNLGGGVFKLLPKPRWQSRGVVELAVVLAACTQRAL